MKKSNMYENAKTWSPFKGCAFDCLYCVPTFKRQAKRQKHNCHLCYEYVPHEHHERLGKIPNSEIVFVCGNGDVAFCRPEFMDQIVAAIMRRNLRHTKQTYYLQSKRPEVFRRLLPDLPPNVTLVTTLETNRDAGYAAVSKAPPPSERYLQFLTLDWPRKVVTIEPVMDFDLVPFVTMLRQLNPDYVWLGFNSHPKSVQLPEPTEDEVRDLIKQLGYFAIPVRGKTLRGIEVG